MISPEELKVRLARSPFRSRFRLNDKMKLLTAEKGFTVLEAQALRIITERLAPACPPKDGKQTPMKGHPVFLAQHATGTCCRSCLEKWHGIPRGRPLTEEETAYIVTHLLFWIRNQTGDLTAYPHTPDLFHIHP